MIDVALGDYEKTVYKNGEAPGLSANNLNKNEDKTKELDTEIAQHLAEKATQAVLGHVKVDNDSITTTPEGVISARKPVDYGRYQAQFGFDGTETYSGAGLNGSVVDLDRSASITSQATSGGWTGLYGTNGVGQRLDGTFTAQIQSITAVEFYLGNTVGTPTGNLTLTIFDETTSTTLSTTSITIPTVAGYAKVTPSTPTVITPGHIIHLRLLNAGGNSSNYQSVGKNTSDVLANSYLISTGDSWSTFSAATTQDNQFNLYYTVKALTGTVTKTYTPSDLKKWGNAKWTQNTPANTSVVCDVLDASSNVLKSAVTSIADLSDIDITTYPSLKLRWTLSRNSVSDESPTASMPSVTWEGQDLTYDSAHTFNANGYQKLSNGLIMQWGGFSATGTVTFPVTFPTAVQSIVIGSKSSTLSYYTASTTSNFTVAGGSSGTYIAIGY